MSKKIVEKIQNNTVDMSEFFEAMGEMIKVFKHSSMKVPGANINDCYVRKGEGKHKGKMFFAFLAKDESLVQIEIRLCDLFANPEEYIDNMREGINQGMHQMRAASRTLIVVEKPRVMANTGIIH